MSFKLKDFIVPFALAVGFTVAFQYYFGERGTGTRSDQIVTGRSHVAPNEAQRALNREVDFIDTLKQEPVLTDVDTTYGKATFSTVGASLQQLEFNHDVSESKARLAPITTVGDDDRCFLVGLEGKTPLYYSLISKIENEDKAELIYKADVSSGTITKKFTIFKRINKIDLDINAEPKGEPLRLRLFYPAPKLKEMKSDVINGVYEEGPQNIQKKPAEKILDKYWESLTLFGAEDKYFLNVMYKDEDLFAQRGYYKKSPEGNLISVLESHNIKEGKNYRLSFYIGPKKISAMTPVTDKLEKTLDYGFFAPLSKLLLRLINFFYSYVFNYGWAIILLTLKKIHLYEQKQNQMS